MLLCTVVSNYKAADVDFLPLTVDYREKFAAAGRYPGGLSVKHDQVMEKS